MTNFSLLVIASTVFFQIANRLITKKTLHKGDPLGLLIFSNTLGALILLPILIVNNSLRVPTLAEFYVIICASFVWAISGYLQNKAMKETELSVYNVITSLQIVWVILGSVLFFDDKISLIKTLGIACIIISTVLVSFKKSFSLKQFSKGAPLTILVTLITASTVLIDSFGARNMDTLYYMFFMLLVPNIFLVFPFLKKRKEITENIKENIPPFILVTLCFLASYGFSLLTFSLKDVTLSTAYPLLRVGNILTVVLAILIFNEKTNITRKLLATALAFFGAVIVKLF